MARYLLDIGTSACCVYVGKIEKKSDEAARRELRRIVRHHLWPDDHGDLEGRLYRWDESANAPASIPMLTVKRSEVSP